MNDMHKFKDKVKKVAIGYTGKIPEIVGLFLNKTIKFGTESNLIRLNSLIEGENGSQMSAELMIGLNFLRK